MLCIYSNFLKCQGFFKHLHFTLRLTTYKYIWEYLKQIISDKWCFRASPICYLMSHLISVPWEQGFLSVLFNPRAWESDHTAHMCSVSMYWSEEWPLWKNRQGWGFVGILALIHPAITCRWMRNRSSFLLILWFWLLTPVKELYLNRNKCENVLKQRPEVKIHRKKPFPNLLFILIFFRVSLCSPQPLSAF